MSDAPAYSTSTRPSLFAYGPMLSSRLQPGTGTMLDEVLAILVMAAVPIEFPAWGILRYPLLFTAIGLFFLWRRDTFALLKRSWFFFILPGFYLLSVLWSSYAYETVRFAAFGVFSLMIAMLFACRLSRQQFILAVMLSQLLIAVASLLYLNTVFVGGIGGGWAIIGLFPHKNVLGTHMGTMAIAATIVLLHNDYRSVWRIIAIPTIALALFYVFNARSATGLVLTLIGILAAIFFSGVWRSFGVVRGLRPLAVALGVLALCTGIMILTSNQRLDPLTYVLEQLGKDTTLTGRTEVWYFAQQMIERNPFLGVGADAFWQPGVGMTRQITSMFSENPTHQFNFHNSYLEVIVHVGFVGFAVWAFTWILAVHHIFVDWLKNQQKRSAFFLIVLTLVLVKSMTESEMYLYLNFAMLIIWTGVFMARRDADPAARPAPQD